MPTTITYTSTSTTRTVKPTQTVFTNSTDKSITLKFQNGTSTSLASKASTSQISTTLTSINYGATDYYSANGTDYTIPAGKTATIAKSGSNLTLSIP